MEDIKYINLVQINPVVIEILEVEQGDLEVPVNNTLCAAHLSWLLTHNCVSWSVNIVIPGTNYKIKQSLLKEVARN